MAIILKNEPGCRRYQYHDFERLQSGAYAISYKAKDAAEQFVFFKQYKSPAATVDWYQGFIDHQQELKRRITGHAMAKASCYEFRDFFQYEEDNPGYKLREFCQVFEFVDASKTLTNKLGARDRESWRNLTVCAKVLVSGVNALHSARIVHTDLKPDNILFIPDASVGTGYRLRVIDLDWAIFTDKLAPWDGKQGYVGTPGYLSPEHVRHIVPTPASDVFTMGIMLSQVLAGRHPFHQTLSDDNRYAEAVTRGIGEPIRIDQPIDDRCDMSFVHRVLNATLHPDPNARPTMQQILDALIGKSFEWDLDFELSKRGSSGREVERKRPEPRKPSDASTPAAGSKPANAGQPAAISLLHDGKTVGVANLNTEFGKRSLFKVDSVDVQYLSSPQFRLVRDGGGWAIEHCAVAANDTLLDGKKVEGRIPVSTGMTICVGNAAKGVAKLPLVIQISRT